ncbi:hypothetical protein N8988_05335, partial [Opitutales bacterium]|nr:hypothetical protein [Opitutales bacterium]
KSFGFISHSEIFENHTQSISRLLEILWISSVLIQYGSSIVSGYYKPSKSRNSERFRQALQVQEKRKVYLL